MHNKQTNKQTNKQANYTNASRSTAGDDAYLQGDSNQSLS